MKGRKSMKPNRNTRLKFSVLLVAVVGLILAPALSAQAAQSRQALIETASPGDMAKVNILLAQGADVNFQTSFGETALTYLLFKGTY
jgi:ankyrin repeat protein